MVDDEPSIGEILKDILGQWGYPVEVALTGPEALEWMQKWHPQVVFLDIWLKEEKEGVDLFYKIKKNWPDTDVILISGHGTVDLAVGLVKDGAWDFIEKPLSLDRLSQSLRRLQEYWSEKVKKGVTGSISATRWPSGNKPGYSGGSNFAGSNDAASRLWRHPCAFWI